MGDRVKGKVAIVTGGGSIGPGFGNGKASAIVYAREGAKVMVVDINIEAAEETAQIIKSEGGECFAFQADVTKASDCKDMVEACIKKYGRIDILHNNVGIARTGGPVDVKEETWDLVMDINVKSMFLTCKYTLPYMEKQGSGAIVNIASIAGISVPYAAVTYTSSKAANIALTRDIAIEYASKGIRANAILPGYLNTPMVAASLTKTFGGSAEEAVKRRDAMVPMGKQGDAWDVAYAALFLASDEAKFITASALIIDGGQTAKLYSGQP